MVLSRCDAIVKFGSMEVGNVTVGDSVRDDLTRSVRMVQYIEYDRYGNSGIWIDHEWLGGGRHPWEVSQWNGILNEEIGNDW